MDKNALTILLNDKLLNHAPHIDIDIKNNLSQKLSSYYKNHYNGFPMNVIVTIEEMSELTQNISKIMREKMQEEDIGVAEEICDVNVCLWQIAVYDFNLSWDDIEIIKEKVIEHDEYMASKSEKDKTNVYLKALRRMSKLSVNLVDTLISDENMDDTELTNLIAHVLASASELSTMCKIDEEKLLYIQDIKLERLEQRLKKIDCF